MREGEGGTTVKQKDREGLEGLPKSRTVTKKGETMRGQGQRAGREVMDRGVEDLRCEQTRAKYFSHKRQRGEDKMTGKQ